MNPFTQQYPLSTLDMMREFGKAHDSPPGPFSFLTKAASQPDPQLDRIESMVRELLDIERRRELMVEYSRLTRGWHP